jgi:hypothetical protein
MRHFAAIVLASFALVAVAQAAPTQTPTPKPIEPPILQKTLEQRIAALEAENAQLRKYISVNADSLTITAPQSVLIRAGMNATVEAAATTAIKGAAVKINNGAKPVARVGDSVAVNGANAHVAQGSPTVFVE